MKKITAFALIAAAALSACAPSAQSVEPVSMSGAFEGISCQKARQLLVDARAEEGRLAAKQNGAAAQDAFSVLLLGLPTSAVTQNNVKGELATAKGRVLALESRAANC